MICLPHTECGIILVSLTNVIYFLPLRSLEENVGDYELKTCRTHKVKAVSNPPYLKKIRQLRVPIWNMILLLCQGKYNITQ